MSEHRHTPDSLADRLDELLPPHQPEQVMQDGDPLVEAAVWVASARLPQMSPEVMARIQSQVMEAHRQQTERTRFRRLSLPRWALVASLAVVMLLVSAIPSALASVPGDVFYPLKWIIEQGELTLAGSPEAVASVRVTHAERRLQEVSVIYGRGEIDPQLITNTLSELVQAAEIVRAESGFNVPLRADLQRRTLIVSAQLSALLIQVDESNPELQPTVAPLLTEIYATQSSGGLLLPVTTTPTASVSPPWTETPLPSLTPIPGATVEPVATSLPINMTIEGPIQSIVGNVITIYGIEIQISPDDPILLVIKVGDVVRIEGNITKGVVTVPVIAIHVDVGDVDVEIGSGGEVWRDTGDCSNPPPDWAPANGWRARCQGQPQPGRGNGNNNNGGGGNNNGQGQGRGQNKDDDDD